MDYFDNAARPLGGFDPSRLDGAVAAQRALSPTRPAIAGLSAVLERLQLLSNTTGDLAHRVAGPVNELGGANEAKAPMATDLRALVAAIDAAISRVEANVQRSLDHL